MKNTSCLLTLLCFCFVAFSQDKPFIKGSKLEICPKNDSILLTHSNPKAGSKYQWYYNGKPLFGDTTKFLFTKKSGNYHLVVTEPVFQSLSPNPTFFNVNDVFFLDAKHGWAVGAFGKVLSTSDNGTTWKEIDVETPPTEVFTAVCFYNLQVGYVLGSKLYQTLDGGLSWNIVEQFPKIRFQGNTQHKIQIFDNGKTIYVGLRFDDMYRSLDGGKSWQKLTKNGVFFYDFEFKDGNQGVALWESFDDFNLIYTTADKGETWKLTYSKDSNIEGSRRVVDFASDNTFLIGNSGKSNFLKSTDNGQAWAEFRVNATPKPITYINNIEFVDDNNGFVLGGFGDVAKTNDGGITWTHLDSGLSSITRIFSNQKDSAFLWSNAESTLWKISPQNKIKTTNIPFKKNGFMLFGGFNFSQVQSVDSSLWAVSRNGENLVYSKDFGKSWKLNSVVGGVWSNRIHFIDKNIGWYLGESSSTFNWFQSNNVWITKNGGDSWNQLPKLPTLPAFGFLRDIYFTNENEGWICGEKGLILHTTNGGQSWEFQLSEGIEKFQRIQFINSQIGWVLGVNSIFKTVDGGRNWIKIYTMSFPINNYGSSIDLGFLNKDFGWVCGGQYPLLTRNGGETWEVVSNSSLALGRAIQFIDSKNGYLINHSLWKTNDGGKNWDFVSPYFGGSDFKVYENSLLAVREYNEIKKYVFAPKTVSSNVIHIKKRCILKCWFPKCLKQHDTNLQIQNNNPNFASVLIFNH